jgi:hypothetical protein
MNTSAHQANDPTTVEMPKPTVAPMVLSLSIALIAVGMATSFAFLAVGLVIFVAGLAMWISQLLPGRGHWHEPRVEPAKRPQPVIAAAGEVERLRVGMPGYRLRLPVKVRPISAGVKGGLVGGLIMPVPAMIYGILSGHGIWWPVNLLAGMAVPGVGNLSTAEMEQFRPPLVALGIAIHIVVSLILGLVYGVLMPMLPRIPKPLAWGALLMPLLWTAVNFVALGIVNPLVRARIEWPWFILSQFVFGVVAALVFMSFEKRNAIVAGLIGGIVGGVLMAVPALLWSLATGHGIWYPINLLSAVAIPHAGDPSLIELQQFHSDWFLAAVVAHAVLSLAFGLAFALVLPGLPTIPAPLAWGALVMPLLWTAWSYGLMGVVNPVLQQRVDWPWFVVSQFVFGLVAAIVVVRSEEIVVPPAGHGLDHPADRAGNSGKH